MFVLLLVLAMAISIMVVPAAAATGEPEIEPCAEIGNTCKYCGGPMVFVRSEINSYKYPTGGCDIVGKGSHKHEVIDHDDVYSCRSCGKAYCVTTSHQDICLGLGS